jgi:hypothetical protein
VGGDGERQRNLVFEGIVMKRAFKSVGMLALLGTLPLFAATDHDPLSAMQGYYSPPLPAPKKRVITWFHAHLESEIAF